MKAITARAKGESGSGIAVSCPWDIEELEELGDLGRTNL